MNVLEKAVRVHRTTNAAARAVTRPVRVLLPPAYMMKAIAMQALVSIAIRRLVARAFAMAEEMIWPRERATVLRLVR